VAYCDVAWPRGALRVALVTNISADHFGEYGIDDLDGLADVKLVVASTLDETGLLVLNADDPLLRTRAQHIDRPIGWFSRDYASATLQAHRARDGATSGVRNDRLIVSWPDRSQAVVQELDLGAIADMPLTVDGTADYNISNIAGAALAALQLGISHAGIAAALARFGADPMDNPGRLMRYDYRGAQVLVDYAHNPEGPYRPPRSSHAVCAALGESPWCWARRAIGRRPISPHWPTPPPDFNPT